MVLAEAQGLLDAGAHAVLVDLDADAASLRSLALWARKFSPLTCVDPPDGIRMNIRGCEHVWGGGEQLVEQIRSSLAGMHFHVRVRRARNYAMAWGSARFGSEHEQGSDPVSLPMEALRFDHDVLESLSEVGVETVQQVLDIPRLECIARLGSAAVARIDAWTGREVERGIDAVLPRVSIRAEQVFDGPVRDLQTVHIVVAKLASEIAERLRHQNRCAEQIDVQLERADLDDWKWSMRMTHPSRDVGHFHAVLRERIDRVDIASGIESVLLNVPRDVPMDAAQQMAWRDDVQATRVVHRARGALIDILQERCGHSRVLVQHAVDTHMPEYAGSLVRPGEGSRSGNPGVKVDRPTRIIKARRVQVRLPGGQDDGVLRGGGKRWQVVAAVGPERLQTPWWTAGCASRTRDYWRLLRADGQWVWVYRCDGAWYLQGAWL